jgi:hypothetical protein
MAMPQHPVQLAPEAVADLNRKLADMRHSVNNHLTLIATALELMRRKPDAIPRMLASLTEQPEKIRNEVSVFSDEFEKAVGITHD